MTEVTAEHFCPGCGAAQKMSGRYPWRFCGACLDRATDKDGRGVAFTNASLSGGLLWRYADSDDWSGEVSAVQCCINGRPVLVTEARFGGAVAQPSLETPRLMKNPNALVKL